MMFKLMVFTTTLTLTIKQQKLLIMETIRIILELAMVKILILFQKKLHIKGKYIL